MIPNTPVEKSNVIAENYLRSSKFRGSGFDGFLQEYVFLEPDRVVALPNDINRNVGAFTEIVSVSYHALLRFNKIAHSVRNRIGIWGDGNLGYITSLLIKKQFPESEVYVFGVNQSKLNDFTFADKTFLVSNIPEGLTVDHAFECVGTIASAKAINQIIDYIMPEGTIALLGVSEDDVPINTRMVLEKGLRLFGSSRSGREDFIQLIEFYKKYPDVLLYLENIVGSVIDVRSIKDITNAFETDMHSMVGKTIMVWDK
jgi:ribitol-5-phosphate 2-dehydrogenase